MSTDKNIDTVYESLKAARQKTGATLPLYFRFEWNGGKHKGEVTKDQNGKLVLAMSFDCGKLPFTAEAPVVRARMMQLAKDTTPRRYGPAGLTDQEGWFVVTPKKRLRYREITSFNHDLTSQNILKSAAIQMIKNRHMMDFARSLWN